MRLQNYVIVVILICGLSTSAIGQWEKIGWRHPIIVSYQIGSTLFGNDGASLYKSIDFAKTWTEFNNNLPVTDYLSAASGRISIDGKICYIIPPYDTKPNLFEPGFYYHSETDNSWTHRRISSIDGKIVTPYPTIISQDSMCAFIKKDSLGASYYSFYLSTDAGTNWILESEGFYTPASTNHSEISTYFITLSNHQIIWRNTAIFDTISYLWFRSDAFYSSSDFGKSWNKINAPIKDTGFNQMYSIGSSLFLIAYEGITSFTNPKRFVSSDYGITWAPSHFDVLPDDAAQYPWNSTTLGSKLFMTIEWPSRHFRLLQSYDSGKLWQSIPDIDTSEIILNVVNLSDGFMLIGSKHVYKADSNLNVIKSTGPTEFWQKELVYAKGTKLFGVFGFNNSFVGFSDSIFISIDNGNTWFGRLFHNGDTIFTTRWVQDGNNLFAFGRDHHSSRGCLFMSIDGGESWVTQTTFNHYIERTSQLIAIGDTLFVSLSNNGNLMLLRTFDKGLKWDTISIPPQYFSQTEHQIDYYRNWLSLSSGYSSSDFGETWIHFPLPMEHVNDYWYTYGAHGNQYILDYSTDFGSTWHEAHGLPVTNFTYPVFFEDNTFFALSYSPYDGQNINAFEGRNSLCFSQDGGKNWEQNVSYFTGGLDFHSNSKYFFAAGQNELWRLPKSLAGVPTAVSTITPTISITNCYPNPASAKMRIEYSIPDRNLVSLKAYDITGRERAIITNGIEESGPHTVQWNTSTFPSGTYILRLNSGGESASKAIQILK